jgi:hypothetical protein
MIRRQQVRRGTHWDARVMMKPPRCPGGTWQGTSACLMFVRGYVLFFDNVEPRALAHLWSNRGHRTSKAQVHSPLSAWGRAFLVVCRVVLWGLTSKQVHCLIRPAGGALDCDASHVVLHTDVYISSICCLFQNAMCVPQGSPLHSTVAQHVHPLLLCATLTTVLLSQQRMSQLTND